MVQMVNHVNVSRVSLIGGQKGITEESSEDNMHIGSDQWLTTQVLS